MSEKRKMTKSFEKEDIYIVINNTCIADFQSFFSLLVGFGTKSLSGSRTAAHRENDQNGDDHHHNKNDDH